MSTSPAWSTRAERVREPSTRECRALVACCLLAQCIGCSAPAVVLEPLSALPPYPVVEIPYEFPDDTIGTTITVRGYYYPRVTVGRVRADKLTAEVQRLLCRRAVDHARTSTMLRVEREDWIGPDTEPRVWCIRAGVGELIERLGLPDVVEVRGPRWYDFPTAAELEGVPPAWWARIDVDVGRDVRGETTDPIVVVGIVPMHRLDHSVMFGALGLRYRIWRADTTWNIEFIGLSEDP